MLNSSALKDAIVALGDPEGGSFNPSNPAAAWATIYDDYASNGEDVSGDAMAGGNKPLFEAALTLANTGSAAQAATEFDNAFVAYWTGVAFGIATPPTPLAPCPSVGGTTLWASELTSAVVAVAPGVLSALLLSIFTDNTSDDLDAKAQQIADAFHSATTSAVSVLIAGLDTTPPPAGPLPITNSCTVF